MYKVVQIWTGRFVCKQVTVCPGHIWTTLYQRLAEDSPFSLQSKETEHLFDNYDGRFYWSVGMFILEYTALHPSRQCCSGFWQQEVNFVVGWLSSDCNSCVGQYMWAGVRVRLLLSPIADLIENTERWYKICYVLLPTYNAPTAAKAMCSVIKILTLNLFFSYMIEPKGRRIFSATNWIWISKKLVK
jgi:hypothetical protein